jgi:hypothetical protein
MIGDRDSDWLTAAYGLQQSRLAEAPLHRANADCQAFFDEPPLGAGRPELPEICRWVSV